MEAIHNAFILGHTYVLNTPDYPVDLQRTCRGAQKHGTRVASLNNRELNVSVKVQTNKGL